MVNPVWIGSPNGRTRQGDVRFIDLHWMVGNLRGTDSIFQRHPGTATHYGIENGVVHQYVEENRSAPGTGQNFAIAHDICIEHAGGWLLPDGTRFKPSPETHETSAQLCADISRRHGLGKLVVGVNVFPHKHWVATACPGTLDIEWIANRANELLGNPAAPASTGPTSTGVSEEVRRVQARLIELGYNLGPSGADGIRGPITIAAIEQFQSDNDLVPDSIVGPLTTAKLWPVAKPAIVAPAFPLSPGWYFGPESGPFNSVSGYHGHRADLRRWQQRMADRGWKITVDGWYGPIGAKSPTGNTAGVAYAFQAEKGLTADKLIGPETWGAAWSEPIT